MSLQNSQFYGANFSYLLHRFDYFVASMQRLGVQNIEFYAAAPHLYLEDATTDDARRIARMLRAAGIQVGCFTAEQCLYPISLASADETLRNRSLAYYEKALAFAQELQSPLMQLISGGALLEGDPEQSRSRSMDGICRLTKLAERAGVKLVLEADPNCTIANTNDQLRAIREIASPQLSGMIDTNALALNGGELFYGGRAAGKGSLPRAFYRHRSSEKWNVPCTGRWNAPDEGLPEGAFRPRLHGRHHAGALGNNLPPLRAAGNGKEPCVSARKQLVKLRKPKNRTCLSNQAGPVLLSEACAFSCQISRRRAR